MCLIVSLIRLRGNVITFFRLEWGTAPAFTSLVLAPSPSNLTPVFSSILKDASSIASTCASLSSSSLCFILIPSISIAPSNPLSKHRVGVRYFLLSDAYADVLQICVDWRRWWRVYRQQIDMRAHSVANSIGTCF